MVGDQEPIEQDEYRVGSWDGKVEDGEACISHDSLEGEIIIDVEELHDLDNLLFLLTTKDKLVRGNVNNPQEVEKVFNEKAKNLEA